MSAHNQITLNSTEMNSYTVIYRKHCKTVNLFAEGKSQAPVIASNIYVYIENFRLFACVNINLLLCEKSAPTIFAITGYVSMSNRFVILV